MSEGTAGVRLVEVGDLIAALHQATPVMGHGIVSLAERVEFIFEHSIARYSACADVLDVVAPTRLRRAHDLARHLVTSNERVVLLHGDLHPGNVLDGGRSRGLVAIDPRACVGDPAFDVVDWVFFNTTADHWEARSNDLASLLDVDPARVWSWCSAFAAAIAAGRIARGRAPGDLDALLDLAA